MYVNLKLTDAQADALNRLAAHYSDKTAVLRAALVLLASTHGVDFPQDAPRKGKYARRAFINCDERFGDRVPRTLAEYRQLETGDEVTFEAHGDEIWRLSQDDSGRQHVDIVAQREGQK